MNPCYPTLDPDRDPRATSFDCLAPKGWDDSANDGGSNGGGGGGSDVGGDGGSDGESDGGNTFGGNGTGGGIFENATTAQQDSTKPTPKELVTSSSHLSNVHHAIKGICGGCMEQFCEATHEAGGLHCEEWLAVVGTAVLLCALLCCCCCCGASSSFFCCARRQRWCVSLCRCCRYCQAVEEDSDSDDLVEVGYNNRKKRHDLSETSDKRTMTSFGNGKENIFVDDGQAAIAIQRRVRGRQARCTVKRVMQEERLDFATTVIQKRVRDMQSRGKFSHKKPGASAAHLITDGMLGDKVTYMTLTLRMHISEAGEEHSNTRAIFTITMVRELAMATGLDKNCFAIKRVSAGSVILVVAVVPNINCPRSLDSLSVAKDFEEQTKVAKSPLRSALLSKLIHISVDTNPPLKERAQELTSTPERGGPDSRRRSGRKDLTLETCSAWKVAERESLQVQKDMEEDDDDDTQKKQEKSPEKKGVSAVNKSMKAKLVALHRQGKSCQAILNHHLLHDYAITEEEVEAVIRNWKEREVRKASKKERAASQEELAGERLLITLFLYKEPCIS